MAKQIKRKFFIVSAPSTRAAGFEVESQVPLRSPAGRRGFYEFPEPPLLIIDRKLGPELIDMEPYGSFWIVSARLKEVLDRIDPDAVVFSPLNVIRKDGGISEKYWLCDIVKVIDVIDEQASDLDVNIYPGGQKFYSLYTSRLVIKGNIIGNAHIFRVPHELKYVFCDGEFKDACRAVGIKGLTFAKIARS